MTNTISGMPVYRPTDATSSTSPGRSGTKSGGFGAALESALEQVDQVHETAQQQVGQLLQGDRQDVHNVMIAVEKADVAFQLMMQVRNKIVNAYQEISRLQF